MGPIGPVIVFVLKFINDVSSSLLVSVKLDSNFTPILLYSSVNVNAFNCGELQQSLDLCVIGIRVHGT